MGRFTHKTVHTIRLSKWSDLGNCEVCNKDTITHHVVTTRPVYQRENEEYYLGCKSNLYGHEKCLRALFPALIEENTLTRRVFEAGYR